MRKIAFVFPGQGAQYPGMGKAATELSVAAGKIFDDGTEKIGLDLRELVFNGSEEDLKITENTQPAIVAASLACMQPLLEAGIKPDMAAGLSLGEYSAHVAAGTFPASDAIGIVRKRGRFMQEAVPAGVGTMAAILGLTDEKVIELCQLASVEGIVEPANFNCPGQIVVSGEIAAVEKLCILAKEAGAKRAIVLAVSAPFHCSMLVSAGERLSDVLDTISFSKMNIPVIANVTGTIIHTPEEACSLLVQQVSTSVKWEACVNTMISNGIDTFIEIGPGKVLSGFIKKINQEVEVYNADDADSIKATIAALT